MPRLGVRKLSSLPGGWTESGSRDERLWAELGSVSTTLHPSLPCAGAGHLLGQVMDPPRVQGWALKHQALAGVPGAGSPTLGDHCLVTLRFTQPVWRLPRFTLSVLAAEEAEKPMASHHRSSPLLS